MRAHTSRESGQHITESRPHPDTSGAAKRAYDTGKKHGEDADKNHETGPTSHLL